MKSFTYKAIERFIDNHFLQNPEAHALFTYIFEFLKQERVPIMTFFELIHEMGHVYYGREVNATIVFVKVSHWLFYPSQDHFICQKEDDDQSMTLLYMDSEANLKERYLHAIDGGLQFSKQARSIHTFSISSVIFNWVNSPTFKFYRKGSDRDLMTAFLNIQGFDQAFHQQYKKAGEYFEKTHNYELTLTIK